MKTTNTFQRLLTVLLAAAAMSLAACGGGGDSAGSTESVLPAGAVATAGDGVNLAEYNAITCGMPRDEVRRIIADAPTVAETDAVMMYSLGGGLIVGFYFSNGSLNQKDIGNGKAAGLVDNLRC
jgi:hypothetical protein